MQLSTLGATGIRVSRIALGCGQLGTRVPGRAAVALVHAALDAGVTLFDTADVYGASESERLLGRALRGRHDGCVVATKLRHAPPALGASRKSLRVALEASLRRLQVDYVDLYQLHAPDPATRVEETVDALQALVDRGLILAYGICNAAPWQVVDVQRVAWAAGRAPLACVQAQLNLLQTRPLEELRPLLARFGLGLLAASPLARGLLGGRYTRTQPPPPGHPLTTRKGAGLWTDEGLARAERVRRLARAHGVSPAQVALAALLAHDELSAVLTSPSTPAQLAELVAADPTALPARELRALLRPDGVTSALSR